MLSLALLNRALWAAPLLIAAVLGALAIAGRCAGLSQHERDGGGHA